MFVLYDAEYIFRAARKKNHLFDRHRSKCCPTYGFDHRLTRNRCLCVCLNLYLQHAAIAKFTYDDVDASHMNVILLYELVFNRHS